VWGQLRYSSAVVQRDPKTQAFLWGTVVGFGHQIDFGNVMITCGCYVVGFVVSGRNKDILFFVTSPARKEPFIQRFSFGSFHWTSKLPVVTGSISNASSETRANFFKTVQALFSPEGLLTWNKVPGNKKERLGLETAIRKALDGVKKESWRYRTFPTKRARDDSLVDGVGRPFKRQMNDFQRKASETQELGFDGEGGSSSSVVLASARRPRRIIPDSSRSSPARTKVPSQVHDEDTGFDMDDDVRLKTPFGSAMVVYCCCGTISNERYMRDCGESSRSMQAINRSITR
jgi:hypothetical protein